MFGSEELLKIYFPYCIKRLINKKYIVLNRYYRPLGIKSRDEIDYESHPSAYRMRITHKQAQKLSWDNRPDVENIFLYNDSHVLERETKDFEAYAKRLNVLIRIKTSEFIPI